MRSNSIALGQSETLIDLLMSNDDKEETSVAE